jgi:2-hydroxy-3-keto-5-methylthiopentenyl-1-phosphate phosphatase
MKICPMEAEFHEDRRTELAKQIVTFRNFAVFEDICRNMQKIFHVQ